MTTLDTLFKEYNADKETKLIDWDDKFKELGRKFCISLDAKLHFKPYEMSDKCDNYIPNNIKCLWCKTYYPNCFRFQPNKKFKNFSIMKNRALDKERRKQKKVGDFN